jgi:hypothetical protein
MPESPARLSPVLLASGDRTGTTSNLGVPVFKTVNAFPNFFFPLQSKGISPLSRG